MSEVRTYVKAHHVYVPVGKVMLCIGSEADVDGATPQQVVEMVYSARKIAEYQMIVSGVNRTRH